MLIVLSIPRVVFANDELEVLTFSRVGGDWGSGPTYVVDIYSDGLISFKGTSNVSNIGVRKIQARPELYNKLKIAFIQTEAENIDFLNCETYLSNHTSVNIDLLVDGKSYSMFHNFGCSGYYGEGAFLDLVEVFQSTLPINKWIKE